MSVVEAARSAAWAAWAEGKTAAYPQPGEMSEGRGETNRWQSAHPAFGTLHGFATCLSLYLDLYVLLLICGSRLGARSDIKMIILQGRSQTKAMVIVAPGKEGGPGRVEGNFPPPGRNKNEPFFECPPGHRRHPHIVWSVKEYPRDSFISFISTYWIHGRENNKIMWIF